MRLEDLRDSFLAAKASKQIQNFRLSHGKQVYESACVEFLDRKEKLNSDRLNFMLDQGNVCAFILILGFSKYFNISEFYEFLSFAYTVSPVHLRNPLHELHISPESNVENMEQIVKLFFSGYESLLMQKQTNLNVRQLQLADESILMNCYLLNQAHTNPIGLMQELISKHIKLNIIIEFSDSEVLNLSFIGLFQLTSSASDRISTKKKRKTYLFSLALAFIQFYINEKRVFDVDSTYKSLRAQGKDQQQVNEIKTSVLFTDLEGKSQSGAVDGGKQKKKKGVNMSDNSESNLGGQISTISGGKVPAFISALQKDKLYREPSKAAGLMEIKPRDYLQTLVVESLVFNNDVVTRKNEQELIEEILSQEYDGTQDETCLKEQSNPKGELLEIVNKTMKTTACLSFKLFELPSVKLVDCILVFHELMIWSRGRATSKKQAQQIAAAKLLPEIREYLKEKELSMAKPKKLVLFSTNTNIVLKKTDKANNEMKNQHLNLQKIIEKNLYAKLEELPGSKV